ncbi:MAG: radical SAM protein [Dehalococcoidia bacterium]
MSGIAFEELLAPLHNCTLCPRDCGADRFSDRLGYCRSGAGFGISSIFAHRGEEPVISGPRGICNIFFSHCNMQCIYCQNYQISRNGCPHPDMPLDEVIDQIERILARGIKMVGFVSPSHYLPQMRLIMKALAGRGRNPIYVFNTNGYDRKETIESLEDSMGVYLPDLKYMDEALAKNYSDAPGYPNIAAEAITEMFRQKGPDIVLNDEGVIESGLIIRHLVLPGQVQNSKECLRFIAEELSTSVHISLMSQYYPTPPVSGHSELDRHLRAEEYAEVLVEFEKLGFWRGWVQDLASPHHYLPDFTRPNVFE